MKVMVVISGWGYGGSQQVARILVKWLNLNNYHSIMLSLNNIEEEINGLGSKNLKCLSQNSNFVKKIYLLRKEILMNCPDIVLVMGLPLDVYVIPAAMKIKTKVIVSERNDPFHFHGKCITKAVSRWLMKFADGFVFQTQDAKNYYASRTKNRGVVIGNPLANLSEYPNPYRGIRKKYFVTIGRLIKQKNQKLLLEAFHDVHEKYPEYELHFWGEGKEKENLIHYSQKLNIQDVVQFKGTRDDVLDVIKDSTAFVLTSDFEGMPNTLMEAMAIGLPCISTDCSCGGPRELIENYDNGILVPVGDREKLKNAMIYLIENPSIAFALEKNALKIRDNYDEKTICEKWVKYFKAVNEERDDQNN